METILRVYEIFYGSALKCEVQGVGLTSMSGGSHVPDATGLHYDPKV